MTRVPTNRELAKEQLNRWFILVGIAGIITTIIDPLAHPIWPLILIFLTGLLTFLVFKTEKYEDVGRNDPCPCGSGIKYKKCCMTKN